MRRNFADGLTRVAVRLPRGRASPSSFAQAVSVARPMPRLSAVALRGSPRFSAAIAAARVPFVCLSTG